MIIPLRNQVKWLYYPLFLAVNDMSRFERQTILKGFGNEGQSRLQSAKVLVVGAGGLGCPALLYLAAAGIGTLGIADGDRVSLSNLNRQVLFGIADVGQSKAIRAGAILTEKYGDLTVKVHDYFLDSHNIIDTLSDYDLVLDATDNFSTRYLLNDACVLLGKPLVSGAIYQHEGQFALLNIPLSGSYSCNYRDLYPSPPQASEVPNCAETGVIGVLPGIIGTMQASETIKYLSGCFHIQPNLLYLYRLLDHTLIKVSIQPNPIALTLIPANITELQNRDYVWDCRLLSDISWQEAIHLWQETPDTVVFLDVRQLDEMPLLEGYPVIRLPLNQLAEIAMDAYDTILVFCQAGKRSRQAVLVLQENHPQKIIYAIEGGIKAY